MKDRHVTDEELDEIYIEVDRLMRAEDFSKIDSILSCIRIEHYPIDILLAYLTVTLPAKKQLSVRADFFESVKHNLEKRGETDPRLLEGLE